MSKEDVVGSEVFHLEMETQQIRPLEEAKQRGNSITIETGHFSVYGFVLLSKTMDAWNVVKDMELYQTTAVGSGGSLSMQSGKINVLLFGRMGSCANTVKVANQPGSPLNRRTRQMR